MRKMKYLRLNQPKVNEAKKEKREDTMDEKIYDFAVTNVSDSGRIDKYLSIQLPEMSRSYIRKLLDEGKVFLNNMPVKANQKVKVGDAIRLVCPLLKDVEIIPENIPLDIVYEDAD